MQENNNSLESHASEETTDKHTVVGIRFRPCGKIYTFETDEDMELLPGTKVIVESEMGLSVGVTATRKYNIGKTGGPLKKVIRAASEKDFETIQGNRAFQDEARAFCVNRVKELDLPMKIVKADTTLDRKRLIFYFTADGRIDFRELVRDLAAKFKTRIEMRQIGVRDEVKLLGGIGVCGRQACCSLFLTNFEPVTIKMAKQQELSINQSKLSGICGRLMCCLGYECRDAAGEKEAAEATASVKPPETRFQQADSDAVLKEEPPARVEPSPAEKEKPAAGREIPPGDKTSASPQDRDSQRRRHSRRDRGRHKKQLSEKHAPDQPVHEKPSQEGAAQKPEGDDKSKAFSRRRKFWKKKKH
ncbi:MAG: stage 0 sporulation family protein [Nitrospiraceae bacterium]|nr:MAG: stage 0 sporulation family protein [Nitrospiraceae bacterium]